MVLNTLSQCFPIDPSCSTSSLATSPTATLDTTLVEESFLVCFSAVYFDPADFEICKFTQLARCADPYFYIIHKLSVALLARQVHPNALLQLVIL